MPIQHSRNVVDVKRAALLPENVNLCFYIHENLPPIHLQYRLLLSKCQCESCKDYRKHLTRILTTMIHDKYSIVVTFFVLLRLRCQNVKLLS